MLPLLQENRKPTFSERINSGVRQAVDTGTQAMNQFQENKAIEKYLGPESKNMPREFQHEMLKGSIQQKGKAAEFANELKSNTAIIRDLEKKRDLPEGSLQAYVKDPKMAEQVTRPAKEGKQALTEKPVPHEMSRTMKKIIADNPNANSDELRILMDEAGIPPVYSNPYTENRRRTQEQKEKSSEDKTRALRAETLPIRTQLANKAMAASQGIQNKEHLLDLIKNGNIDDPTFAQLAESLPLKLGKRLLSNDTVEYKAGLIEEFGDLRNIFQGQTRIKEIELLEEKLADLYLTDDQKESILKSRITALKADQIRAEVAQEIENEPYGILQFNQELEKRAKPKLEALFNKILDEQKAIIQDAENKKKLPLDFNDPDDKKIAEAIIKESGGDRQKARALAKKKGYTF